MKAALHRSIIFWSGILVMSFLAWAWRDSLSSDTEVRCKDLSLQSYCGGLALNAMPGDHSWWNWWFRRPPSGYGEFGSAPQPFFLRGGQENADAHTLSIQATKYDDFKSLREIEALLIASDPPRHWMLFLPYWLVIAAFTLPWFMLLIWRARRRRRIPKETASA